MFTGIVEEVGRTRETGQGRLVISAERVLDGLEISDSICVNGVCLTVVDRDRSSLSVNVVPETLRRTNLGDLSPGDPVNLERAMAVGSRFGGHLVQGHVDATGTIQSIEPDGDAMMVSVAAPEPVMRYVVEKGFIAVDGMSLTVVDCHESGFSVTIIPYTRDNTSMASASVGNAVNLEPDIVAKYVERLAETRLSETG